MATKRKLNTRPKTLPDRRDEPAFVAHAERMARALEDVDKAGLDTAGYLKRKRDLFMTRRVDNGDASERVASKYLRILETQVDLAMREHGRLPPDLTWITDQIATLRRQTEKDAEIVSGVGGRTPLVNITLGGRCSEARDVTPGPLIEGQTPTNPVMDAGEVFEALTILGDHVARHGMPDDDDGRG